MRRGNTLLSMLIAAALGVVLLGAGLAAFTTVVRRTDRASAHLGDLGQALRLLDQMRLELSSLVLHPSWQPAAHRDNTFVISRPAGSSIQFVMERMESGLPVRYLVHYAAARSTTAGEGLELTRTVWRFLRFSPWNHAITFPGGWPADWIGPVVERRTYRFRELRLDDVQWLYLPPDDAEGRVFFRLRLSLVPRHGGAPVPLTTLISVDTPELSADVVDCPCLFSDRYDPEAPDCHACTEGNS